MRPKPRNTVFVLLGALALVAKRHYAGPHPDLVHSYAGNVTVSFAVYFILASLPPQRWKYKRLLTAALALLVVSLFEATDGFHLMANTYDPYDFLANAIGIAIALPVDRATSPP